MKKKKQKKTDAAGKYTRPAAGPGGSGPGISSGPYGGAQQLPAVQTIPFQPLQIQQEPMQPLPLAPGYVPLFHGWPRGNMRSHI